MHSTLSTSTKTHTKIHQLLCLCAAAIGNVVLIENVFDTFAFIQFDKCCARCRVEIWRLCLARSLQRFNKNETHKMNESQFVCQYVRMNIKSNSSFFLFFGASQHQASQRDTRECVCWWQLRAARQIILNCAPMRFVANERERVRIYSANILSISRVHGRCRAIYF